MQSGSDSATTAEVVTPRPQWVVEVNIGGCRFRRWADKRRHLLAPLSLSRLISA